MDKRFFLALLLTAIVVVITPLLFPGAPRRPVSSVAADSGSRRSAPSPDSTRAADSATPPTATAGPAVAALGSTSVPIATNSGVAETTTVRVAQSTYGFSSRGAVPVSVILDEYVSTGKGATRPVQLVRPGTALTHFRLALGRDTIALDSIPLQADVRAASAATPEVTYTGTAAGRPVRLTYQVVPDSFVLRVRAQVTDAPAGSSLLVELPRTMASNEADTTDDLNHLAVSYRARGEVSSDGFGSLDSAETKLAPGPITWMATRSKYFLIAYRAAPQAPFASLRLTGMPERNGVTSEIQTSAALPLTDGAAGFDIYAGPQDAQRLVRLGADMDQVNPYGGFMNGVVQPFSSIVMSSLLWMKRTTQLNYGWVLVIFGVLVRLALWPLNQGAMRTSLKMQVLQPELAAIQKKYSDDPKRQQEAIMKVYKDHGMSPLSPVMGCLPMLLPMPILFALYHVFQNTIEFRGVSFLWLPDLSLYDPYYVTPILMGLSMFAMSWVGMRGMPANTQSTSQAKMMMYMMPVVLTVVFFKFAAGLNLYYAVQNVAAIPQQWLIARERLKQPPPPIVATSGIGPTVKRRS